MIPYRVTELWAWAVGAMTIAVVIVAAATTFFIWCPRESLLLGRQVLKTVVD
jgi:hypothetical protein